MLLERLEVKENALVSGNVTRVRYNGDGGLACVCKMKPFLFFLMSVCLSVYLFVYSRLNSMYHFVSSKGTSVSVINKIAY